MKFSAITIDGHRHAGRGGSGAVMGSKNLKGIALSGSSKIPLHTEEGFTKKAKEVKEQVQENDFVPKRRKFGTPYWVKPINDEGFIPTRNFQEGRFEFAKEINADTMQERIVDGGGACYNAFNACLTRSGVKGTKRRRIPTASKTAFAMAAGIGPRAPSPTPIYGSPGRLIRTISTVGASRKRRMG